MKKPLDLFSKQATWYQKYRPSYPPELYRHIVKLCTDRKLAWDCATGNGQVAVALSAYFDQTIATDISEAQLAQAEKRENIFYKLAPAEQSPLDKNSVDLITVGQALHWFNHKAFNTEARRVLKPGGIIAVWGYGLPVITVEIDKRLAVFYNRTVGHYWHPARKHIEDAYREIPLDFELLPAEPQFNIKCDWELHHFEGYVRSWSSVQKYIDLKKDDPVPGFIETIRNLWGTDPLRVTFPLFIRLGRKHK